MLQPAKQEQEKPVDQPWLEITADDDGEQTASARQVKADPMVSRKIEIYKEEKQLARLLKELDDFDYM